MPRKYSVEFKEKAVHQIIEMVRLESAHCNAPTRRSVSYLGYLTIRCGLGTVTVLQYVMTLTLQVARQWKKSSSVCAAKTAS